MSSRPPNPPEPADSVAARMSERIDPETRVAVGRMLVKDTLMTLGFLILLWAAYAIVAIVIRPVIVSTTVYVLFLVCIALIALYNTTSLLAMVRNMRRDRFFIYMRDIVNLRAARAARESGQPDAAAQLTTATPEGEG